MQKVLLKKIFFAISAISLLSAKSVDSAKVQISGLELINLPFANRAKILTNISDDIYQDVKKIAFSDKQGMKTRWHAIMTMAQIKKNETKSDLRAASRDPAWYIRNASLVALSQIDLEESLQVARILIKDKALVVRSAAVEVLQKSKDQETRALLWEELRQAYNFRNKQSLWIRSQIVEVLIEKPLASEKEFFAGLLNDSDPKVAYLATFALERIHGSILGKTEDPIDKIKKWQAQLKKNYIEI